MTDFIFDPKRVRIREAVLKLHKSITTARTLAYHGATSGRIRDELFAINKQVDILVENLGMELYPSMKDEPISEEMLEKIRKEAEKHHKDSNHEKA